MLETKCKEIINKNTFLIHFIDKNINEITVDQTNKINHYKTDLDSEITTTISENPISPSLSIELKIKYPPNFYNLNYYELFDMNEESFQDFYNEIMDYNETMDYSDQIDSKEKSEIRSINL